MSIYDENSAKAEDALRPLLTPEFLATLVQAVKTCGWMVDHIESVSFVYWCFNVAGQEPPNLDPFDYREVEHEPTE